MFMALELAQQMQKVTAAQAATAAAAAAEQDLRQVTEVDNTAGHNSSGAGLVQAEQGKNELQESKGSRQQAAGSRQQAAQEPYKSPVRAEAATRELERVRGRAEEAKTEPEKLVQSAASSGQQKALRLPIGMAGPASAVFGHK